jgi:hypothetical protein
MPYRQYERNILHTLRGRKANVILHMMHGNCLVRHVIEGNIEGRIEVTGRRGGRRKRLLDDLKETRRYCKLKEEALDGTVCRTGAARGLWTCRKAHSGMNGDHKIITSPDETSRHFGMAVLIFRRSNCIF